MNLRGINDLSEEHFAPQSKGKAKRYLAIDVKRGPYKANMSNYAGIDARTVIFYGVGDADRVVELIRNHLPGIGRSANAGAGEIVDVNWKRMTEDYSWITPSGLPARPLPLAVWNKISAFRPVPVADLTVNVPYWNGDLVSAAYPLELSA